MKTTSNINREDMLELTRRMTVKRNCFSRIAGVYFDEEGFIDGTFNRHFGKLTLAEREEHLKLAKSIPFAPTNTALKEYTFTTAAQGAGGILQLLQAMIACELKNDALMDVFYDYMGQHCPAGKAYACDVFFGVYDIPRRSSDKEEQWESEEIFPFLICAICGTDKDYNQEIPAAGFLYPAYKDRAADPDRINIFRAGEVAVDLAKVLSCVI